MKYFVAFCSLPSLTPHLRIVSELPVCPKGTCALNTDLLLTCDPGYNFVGDGQITYRGTYTWFPSEYRCEGIIGSFKTLTQTKVLP